MGEKGRAVRLGAALALQLCALWGTGTFWYFRTSDPAFDALPTVGMVVMCACLLGLGLASASSATLGRHARTCSTAACVAAPCSALVALAGGGFAQTGDAVGLALAVLCCLASWACNAFSLLACAGALTSLGLSARIAAVVCAAVCAVAPRSLARLAVDAGQGVMLFVASMLMCAAACALARRESCALFERTTQASEAPADVQLTQPATFLPLGHGLYLLLGVFGFAAGMSFFFGIDADFAHVSALSIAPLALIALVGLRVRSRVSLDALHIASFVIAAGAFLSIGFVWDESIVVSGALFGAAEACFYVLMFTLLAAIAQRNERNASVVFGWGLGLFALGWGVCGSGFNALAHIFIMQVPTLVFPLAWAFIAFNAWFLRGFSLDAAVAGIEETRDVVAAGVRCGAAEDSGLPEGHGTTPACGHRGDVRAAWDGAGDSSLVGRRPDAMGAAGVSPVSGPAGHPGASVPAGRQGSPAGGAGAPHASAAPSLEERIAGLAQASGLTDREREVFDLLARGRNAHYLQEQLGISRNTAKTHIAHIYTKLGVHSQQELIDLLEGSAL